MSDDLQETAERHLLYFADPMCSWCWGFSPSVDRMIEDLPDTLEIRPVMGGLRPGTTEIMHDRAKDSTRNHWEHVKEASGQPFDFEFFNRNDFVCDTEPACRAVVTARRLDAGKALAVLKSVQHAFYAENRDVTNINELAAIAQSHGFEDRAFHSAYEDAETITETQGDFWLSQASGVTGFPTLLAVEDGKAQIVTIGYRRWEDFGPALSAWAAEQRA